MITLYGIPNCDTVKKARAWLTARGIAHDFYDYKKAGIEVATLERWAGVADWEALLNRRGTTFRGLPEAEKADLDGARAIALMKTHPSLIRRPVVEGAGPLLIGFDETIWAERLAG